MGICWSCVASKSSPSPSSPALPPASNPIPDPDLAPSTIADFIDGDLSFLGSNVSRASWYSMATTNVTTWLSQASGAIAAFWGNNAVDDNEFLSKIDDEALPDVGIATDSRLRDFTFAQLKAATFNFRTGMILGKGGFGTVYKGWLKEKLPSKGTRKLAIAVKKLDSGSKQGIRQWRTEVGFLGRLSHPNIVKLLGYCRENEQFLIVYEFMQKGSLNYHLFGRGSNRLPWEIRLKIMIGMARGLSHLHTMEKPIIFRDFKSSNVLLNESYDAKISDFGLAKWGPPVGDLYVSGHVMGTAGYTDPEYTHTGNLYVKSDVYSFGVVLVEMLTGLRAIDKGLPSGQRNLVNWIIPYLSTRRKLKLKMDNRLEGKYPLKQASKIGILALRCLQPSPQTRPSMKEVAETLEKIEAEYRTSEKVSNSTPGQR